MRPPRTMAETVAEHQAADAAMGREWATGQGCGCGACRQARRVCNVCKGAGPTTWRPNFVAPGAKTHGAMVCAACLAADQAKGVKPSGSK
jgi:hypothetical protein